MSNQVIKYIAKTGIPLYSKGLSGIASIVMKVKPPVTKTIRFLSKEEISSISPERLERETRVSMNIMKYNKMRRFRYKDDFTLLLANFNLTLYVLEHEDVLHKEDKNF